MMDNRLKVAESIERDAAMGEYSGAVTTVNGDNVHMSHPEYGVVNLTWEEYKAVAGLS